MCVCVYIQTLPTSQVLHLLQTFGASLDKQLSIIVWSSPDFDSSSLSLVLRTKVKKVQHKRMVIKNSFVTKDQNMKQKSKRKRQGDLTRHQHFCVMPS